MSKELRTRLRKIKSSISSEIISRQPNVEESVFPKKVLDEFQLLSPYYDPIRLYNIVENAPALDACIEAMEANIDGFGHEFLYTGKKEDKFNDEVLAEKKMLEEFFDRVNEQQSFPILRRELRRGYDTTGNAYIEVVRFPNRKIAALYRADERYVRLQKKQDNPVPVKIELNRFGMPKQITVYKRFRRYAMLVNPIQGQIRWFKEYGDPRRMCAVTGKYEDELQAGEKIQEEATEIIHIKHGNGIYGTPRWIGLTSVVLGLQYADFVNFDLFNNQVVPPLAVLVSNGTLTEDSVRDLCELFENKRGVDNFHKILILEALPVSTSNAMEDSRTAAKVDLKEFSMARKEDAIFKQYIELSEKRIRARYRLPPLYLGVAEEYSRSTSDSSKLVAEEQLFKPERNKFDEIVNLTIMKELGAKYWKFQTVGPRMIEGNEVIDAFEKFADAGVLTINQGIKIVNHVLGLDAQEYDQVWANYPVPLIMELLQQGRLRDIEEIDLEAGDVDDALDRVDKFVKWAKDIKNEKAEKLATELRDVLIELRKAA